MKMNSYIMGYQVLKNQYNQHGLHSVKVFVLLFLMFCVCLTYAFCWQKIIKHFDLHIAYANRSMYLVWSQIWAVAIFSETVTPKNVLGMLVVMAGVIVIALGEEREEGV
jgi:drug/metabolite transporter (DMT)-like permease